MLFITLLQPKGKGEEAIKHIKALKAPRGVEVRGVYFTLGRFDAVIIFEAPDLKAAIRFAMDVGLATGYTAETLTAIPAGEV